LSNYFCTNNGRDCGCPPPCPQPPCPQPSCPQPPTPPRCPCSENFRRILDLICCPRLQPLVDFSAFAFVTNYYVLGSGVTAPAVTTAPGDNLVELTASYVCGSDSCEALTVSGLLFPPEDGATALEATVTQAALCRLNAVVFAAAETADATAAANFQTISQTLSQILRPQKPQDCSNLADALTNAAAIRASTVTSGPLIVQNSTILGQSGNILVMANSTDNRFYLICADKIDYMG